jgi:L-iditol 2-dehydrogenase
MPETLSKSTAVTETQTIPSTMKAAVYRGLNDVRLEEVPVPEIGRGEMLVRVHNMRHLRDGPQKISTGSHSSPRIFGHETRSSRPGW